MKRQTTKIGKIIKLVTGGLLLAALMVVNVQVGTSDASTDEISLFGMKTSVFTPVAVASGGCHNWYASYRDFWGNCAGERVVVCESLC